MFKLHVVQARFGDCLVLEFGPTTKPRRVLIDGGPPGTFDASLADALVKLTQKGNKFDLAVLSHVDNDHVCGLLELMAALEEDIANSKPARYTIGGLWHNSFQRTLDPDAQISQRMQMLMTLAANASTSMPMAADAFLGIREGGRLRSLAAQLGIKVNKGFKDDMILCDGTQKTVKIGSLTLRIVGPTPANLDELRKAWLAWLAKTEEQVADNPTTAANADKSVPNLSSIVLHAQYAKKTVLLTGDARGDHIEAGLKAAKLLDGDGKLHVDVLKVQHHGSNRNATSGFFERITADKYVISADGTYGNPDLDTMGWIVKTAKAAGRNIGIVVTNETDTTRQLVKDFKPADFGYTLTVRPQADSSIAIDLG